MKFDHKLTNSLKSDAQTFSKLTARIGRSKMSSRRSAPGPGSALLGGIRSGIVLKRQSLPRLAKRHLFISSRLASLSSFNVSSAFSALLRSSLARIAISVLDFLRSKCVNASFLGFGQNEDSELWGSCWLSADSSKAIVWGIERLNTATSGNDPQRDQKTQFPRLRCRKPTASLRIFTLSMGLTPLITL